MWGKKDSTPPVAGMRPVPPAEIPALEVTPVASPAIARSGDPERSASRPAQALIGKSVIVKGEISGSEDLYVDGEVRGGIELREHSLIVGTNGKVEANVTAREIVVQGTLNGNVHATDKIEIRKTG